MTASYEGMRAAIDQLRLALDGAERASLTSEDLDPFDVYAPRIRELAEQIDMLVDGLRQDVEKRRTAS
jgi:hypothetical protein